MKNSVIKMVVLTLWLVLFSAFVYAADVPMEFDDIQTQIRYQDLLEELRCLVCQNQTLADSHAELAQDLRNQVYRMIAEGKDNNAIVDFMVTRYGDFVLYRPPLKNTTLVLWFGPFVLLLIGLLSAYLFIRSRKTKAIDITEEEQNRVNRILRDKGEP